MGRDALRPILTGLLGGAVILTSATALGWGTMSSNRYTLSPLTSSGDGPRFDAAGRFAGISGLAGTHTAGSACEDPETDGFGPPGSDLGCWATPGVQGEPGTTARFGWFHKLCSIDKTPPLLTAPAPLINREQNDGDGWTTVMGWPNLNAAVDPDLVPDATDETIPVPLVYVRWDNMCPPLTQSELARGGRLINDIDESGHADECGRKDEGLDVPGAVTFALGTTTIHYKAVDCGGNTALDSTTVTVIDTTAPDLEFDPPDTWVTAMNHEFGEIMEWPDPLVHEDICDTDPILDWNVEEICPEREIDHPDIGAPITIAAGRCFLYCDDWTVCGNKTVTINSTDASGNSVSRDFTYHIIDDVNPTISLFGVDPNNPVVREEQEERCGTKLAGKLPNAIIADNATPNSLLTVELFLTEQDPGLLHPINREQQCFPLHDTTVGYFVTDLSNNFASKEVIIRIEDTTKPAVSFVSVPPRRWHSFTQWVTIETTDICDANLDISVFMEDSDHHPLAPVPNQQDRWEAGYSADRRWAVSFTVEDESGNSSATGEQVFGVDKTPPKVVYEGIPQTGVNPQDPNTWPVYFKGDKVDTLTGGTDDPGRTGHYSGWLWLRAVIDPGIAAAHEMFLEAFSPTPDFQGMDQGPRDVSNIRCTNPDICANGLFDPYRLTLGPHRVVMTAEDVAGNNPDHQYENQRPIYHYYFNVFDLLLALEQADAMIKRLLDDPETPEAARFILEGEFAEDESGDPVREMAGVSNNVWTGWYVKETEGVIDWVGFLPEAKSVNAPGGFRHNGAYMALSEWHRLQRAEPGYWGRTNHREFGNVLLYIADIVKRLRTAGEYVDTVMMREHLTRGSIAETTGFIDYAAGVADPQDSEAQSDLAMARAHRNQAINDHAMGSHNQALTDLMNAMFFVEHSLFRLERELPFLDDDSTGERAAQNEQLVSTLQSEMQDYCFSSRMNGTDLVCTLWRANRRINGACAQAIPNSQHPLHEWCLERVHRFGPAGLKDSGGGGGIMDRTTNANGLYLNETTWLHVLLEFVDYVRMLDAAQAQHVWVRWWQWEYAHLTKYLTDFSRTAACRMHLMGNPILNSPLCANFSDHELLDETRCRYVTGIELFDQRKVDEALRAYAGSECVMRKVFDEVYNTLIDNDADGVVPDCRNIGAPGTQLCVGDPCECPAGTWPIRRYMPDEYPELQYPEPPRCPPRDDLFTYLTATGPDLVTIPPPPADDGPDDVPDWFTCDGEVYCPDNGRAVPGYPTGECDPSRL